MPNSHSIPGAPAPATAPVGSALPHRPCTPAAADDGNPPDAVLHADPAAVRMGASAQAEGAEAVARFFAGRAEAARLALVNGIPAAVWAPGGRPQVVFMFTISGAKITGIGLTADPDLLRDLDIVFLSSRGHRSAKGHVHHSP